MWQYWVDDFVDGKRPGWYDYFAEASEVRTYIYMYSLYNICTYHHYTSQIYEVYILCTINDIVNIRIFPRTQPPLFFEDWSRLRSIERREL
eukprot:COSAG06_NODE_907_length_11611_cov_13.405316_4_plen_91_part_00